jgi:hypothetical protein
MCLPDLNHNWPRYVMPSGIPLSLSNGLLPDTDGRYEQYANPKLRPIGDFFSQRCCVLLGDAGIGKSEVLTKEYSRVLSGSRSPRNVIFRSLREFGSDATAKEFLASPEIAAWVVNGTEELFLFLDSLDEALLKVDTWSSLLGNALASWPLDRLWFRITCRPAFWPASLSMSMRRGFGDGVSEANLAPLRQCDIESAATEHKIVPDLLLQELHRANAATFAARPLTLKMIFGIFAKDNKLPKTHAEMYELGCQYLASEHNTAVLEGRRLTNVPIGRRKAIIERIAAMSVFCDRRFIQHPNAADASLPEGTLTTSEICSNDLRTAELQEVLACALFSFQDPQILVWSNWSYAEFLAASWCVSQQLTTASIKSLISVVGDKGAGIPQQLSSSAIWICELRRELQRILVDLNPSLLMFIDESAVRPSILPRLVKRSIEQKTTWELGRQIVTYAHRFKHPRIAKQLSGYLRRPRKQWECGTAIYIAIACELSELSDELVKIANNARVSLDLRQLAAAAIAQTGTEQARKAIRHFATNPVPEDASDNLKGCALSANWPANFSFAEVMPLISRPQRSDHAGHYESFLHRFGNELDANLSEDDVLTVMRWAQQDWLAAGRNAFFDPIVDGIMLAAWERLSEPSIREAFAITLLIRLRNHVHGFPRVISLSSEDRWQERLRQNDKRRILLLVTTVLLVEDSPYLIRQVCSTLLVGPSDSQTLLVMARAGNELTRRKISTIFFMLGWGNANTLDAIFRGTQEGVLDTRLESFLAIEPGSEIAEQLREDYGRENRAQAERQETIDNRLRALQQLLDRSEAGEPDIWFGIWDRILMASWPSVSSWSGSARLDRLGCWGYFDDPTCLRIYQAAESCVVNGTRLAMDFIGGNGWPSWASAEVSALLNTIERSPNALLAADDEAWQRWSTLSLWNTFNGEEERDRAARNFLARRIVPFLAAAEVILDIYVRQGRCYSISGGLGFDWPADFAQFLLDRIRRIELTNSCWDTLCSLGMAEAPRPFEEYLWEELSRLRNLWGNGRNERIITVINLLLHNCKPGTWTALSEVIYAEPIVGQDAIARVGDLSDRNNWIKAMTDGEIAEFYIWMSVQFPADIGQIRGVTFLGSPVRIRMLRDSTLIELRSRGNLKVFRSVLLVLSDLKWLRGQIPYVVEAHFRKKWKVETPTGLLQMAAENSVPWYMKERFQLLLLTLGLLSVAVSIAGFVTESNTSRLLALVISLLFFLAIAASLIRLRMLERKPAP